MSLRTSLLIAAMLGACVLLGASMADTANAQADQYMPAPVEGCTPPDFPLRDCTDGGSDSLHGG